MARFVLLYFGDDDRADTFVESTRHKVVGLYDDPRGPSVCKCKSQTPETTNRGWTMHPYWGWQVHPFCNRAGKWWRAEYGKRLFRALGVNMLPREDTPSIMQGPQGWGHPAYKPTDDNTKLGVEHE
jgi:hypothetical protein